MYGLCILCIGKGVNGHLVRYHERGIEAQSEVADNLVLIGLVLILFHEIPDTGKCNLVNVLVNLILGHAQTAIRNLNGLVRWINAYLDPVLHILRSLIFPHQLQLLKLGNGIRTIADKLPVKNIMVRIQPFLDYRENVLACN